MGKNADDTNKGDGGKDLDNLPFITTGPVDSETEMELIHVDSYNLEEANRLRVERQQQGDEEPKDLAELGRLLGRFPMHDTTVVDGDLEIQALVLDHQPQAESRQTSSAPAQNAQH
jgi:hypothetical protein